MSSQRIYSELFKMLIALNVISLKLPIGVETIYNQKLSLFFVVSDNGIMKL